MDAPSSTGISLFEGFRLDRRAGVLCRLDDHGVFAPTEIGSRALDVLGVLVDRSGDLVSRTEIMDAVWPVTAVEDSNLNVQIAALRRILDHDRQEGSCIQTVSGRGYRFVAPVIPAGARGSTDIRPAVRQWQQRAHFRGWATAWFKHRRSGRHRHCAAPVDRRAALY